MAKSQGFPCEVHHVTTKDGYILELDRLPRPGKPVVYLANQLGGSAAAYLALGKNQAIGYLLYNLGFDVWLGNFRGSPFSLKHTKLSSADDKFWQFSWQENGALDNPAMLEYILRKTKQPSLVYGGHSMGATTFFVMLSERPELASKIRAAFLFAPPVFLSHTTDPMMLLLKSIVSQSQQFANKLKLHGKPVPLFQAVLKQMCPKVPSACHVDPTKLGTLKGGVSVGQLVHFAQLINSETFRKYDYGSAAENKAHYGSAVPPEFNLRKANVPVYIYNGPADTTCTKQDVEKLRSKLPNVKQFYYSKDKAFAHTSYISAKNAREAMWVQVLRDAKPYLTPPASS